MGQGCVPLNDVNVDASEKALKAKPNANARGEQGWRVVEHTADTGLEIVGETLPQLFERAAAALFAQVVDRRRGRRHGQTTVAVDVCGVDWPDLMFNWLRELLYLWNGSRQIVAGVRVRALSPYTIRADVSVEDYDPAVHRLGDEIKAVTYHQLQVAPNDGGWRAQVILDV